MMNKFLLLLILLGFGFIDLFAQTQATSLYALPKDSNVFRIIEKALAQNPSTKEKAKLNYYGFLIADSLDLPQIKNQYILNLYELSLLTNSSSFEILFQKKIDKRYLTPEQNLRLSEIEFLQKQKILKTDSLLIWLCHNYLNQTDTALEWFYAQKIIPILRSGLSSPQPLVIRAAIKLKNFYVAAQLLKDIDPDSALVLVKIHTDSSSLSRSTTIEINKWLLLAAYINYKLNNLKEANALIGRINISELDALDKADYYRTCTYLALAQKRFAQMAKVSQLWLSNAFLISDVNHKHIHFGQLKNFYGQIGNKKLAAVIQDSINFYVLKKSEHIKLDSVSFAQNESDGLLAGILEAVKEFHKSQKTKNQSYFPEWFHWIFESVLFIGLVWAIFLFKKRPRVIKEIVKEAVEVEATRKVESSEVSSINASRSGVESSELHSILFELQQNFKLNFQKTFKRSVFNVPNSSEVFVGFYDLRISKVAAKRGIILFVLSSDKKNNKCLLLTYLRLNSLITEKGITQPSVLMKEVLPKALKEVDKTSGMVLFLDSSLKELTFCGTGISLQIKRKNRFHDLTRNSAAGDIQQSILQDNLLELEKEDILVIKKSDCKVNPDSVAEYIRSVNVFEESLTAEVGGKNFVLGLEV